MAGPPPRPRVLVTSTTHPDGIALLHAHGLEVVRRNPNLTPVELETVLATEGSFAGIVAGNTPLTRKAIAGASRTLGVVSRHGVGYNGVDVEALTERGIALMVTGTANSTSVAEHTLMYMLALGRKLWQWDQEAFPPHRRISHRTGLPLAVQHAAAELLAPHLSCMLPDRKE